MLLFVQTAKDITSHVYWTQLIKISPARYISEEKHSLSAKQERGLSS